MKCIGGRLSYASQRYQVFHQLLLTSANLPTRVSSRGFSSTWSTHNQAGQDSSTQDAPSQKPSTSPSRTKRNPTPKQRPSDRLPQSPLLTKPNLGKPPSYNYHKRKATEEDVAEFVTNPWAQALLAPVRLCAATRTRIPRSFMNPWGLVREEGADELWMMPVSMLGGELEGKGEKLAEETSQASTRKRVDKHPKMLRMLNSVPLLRELNSPFSRNSRPSSRSPVVRLLPSTWKYPLGPITAKEEKRIAWMDDMPDFVMEKLRKMAVEKVVISAARWKRDGREVKGVWRVVEMGEGYSHEGLEEGLKGLEKIGRMQNGGVVLMGSSGGGSGTTGEAEQATSLFPDFVKLPQTQSKVPVFDLGVLLSEREREELRSFYEGFQNKALYLTPDDRVGVEALTALWNLKCGLREFDHGETGERLA